MARVALTGEQKVVAAQKSLTLKCKKLLRAEGITQSQLADYVGCTQQAISYELKEGLSLKTLIAISMLLDREIFSEKDN